MQYRPYRPPRLWDWQSFNTNAYYHLNENLERIRREIRRQECMRSTVGSSVGETPKKFYPRSRPMSAARNHSSEKSRAHLAYKPASVGRKYYPRYTTDTIDIRSIERRRMRIDDAVRRYETESNLMREEFNRPQPNYLDMHDDLVDVRVRLNEHMTKLHAREQILQDELDRLGSETRTVSHNHVPYFGTSETALNRPQSCRRKSYGDANHISIE